MKNPWKPRTRTDPSTMMRITVMMIPAIETPQDALYKFRLVESLELPDPTTANQKENSYHETDEISHVKYHMLIFTCEILHVKNDM